MNIQSQRTTTLYETLISIQKSDSLAEIENIITKKLETLMGISSCKIKLKSLTQTDKQNKLSPASYSCSLNELSPHRADVHFVGKENKDFTAAERKFLDNLVESSSLFIHRILQIEQAEVLKLQWEGTFDSILDPICLVNQTGQLVRINKCFSDTIEQDFTAIIGGDALNIFFGHPVRNIKRPFKNQQQVITNSQNQKVYEVSIQEVPHESDIKGGQIFLMLFRDITEEQQLEKQVFESAKMVELGTIGSSIAHELNNPIGGILSFIQLIQMNLSKDSSINPDIKEMEAAALNCQAIITRLLDFSRKNEDTDFKESSLKEIIQESIELSQIYTRSRGINIDFLVETKSEIIRAQKNLLIQAFHNILQNSGESLFEKINLQLGFDAKINITLRDKGNNLEVEFVDNGLGISPQHLSKVFNPLFSTKNSDKNSGLGLTLAYKIVHEHGGEMEVFSRPKIETRIICSFERPGL